MATSTPAPTQATTSSPPRPKMKKRGSLFGLKKIVDGQRRGSESSAGSADHNDPASAPRSPSPSSPRSRHDRFQRAVSPPPPTPPLPKSISSPPTSAVQWTGNRASPKAASSFKFPVTPAAGTASNDLNDLTTNPADDFDDLIALRSHHHTTLPRSRRESAESPAAVQHLGAPFSFDDPLTSGGLGFRRPRSDSAPARHSRGRSHFSIPDVVVTSCEEEGQEIHFEVKLLDEKRRTKFPTAPQEDHQHQQSPTQQSSNPRKSLGNIIKPFLGFDGEASPLVSAGPYGSESAIEHVHQQAQTVGPQSNVPGKRTRKSSLPMLFGRGNKNKTPVEEAAVTAATTAPPPPRSSSPYSQAAFDSSGSLPSSSSRDSLHSSASASSIPLSSVGDIDLATPPDTPSIPMSGGAASKNAYLVGAKTPLGSVLQQAPPPVTVQRPLTKKEQRKLREKEEMSRKLREKEEVALMRELARVDKMVRQHDAKADKMRAKEEKMRAKSKSGSGSSTASSKEDTADSNTGRFPKALKRMTMFGGGNSSAGKNGASRSVPAASGGLVRKVSTNRRPGGGMNGSTAGAAAPNGNHTTSTAAPARPRRPPSLHANAGAETGRRPTDKGMALPRRNKDSDESERLSFSAQEWADLPQFDSHGTAMTGGGLTSLTGLDQLDLSLDTPELGGAPVARRRSKRRSAMAANRGSMAVLYGSGSGTATPSSSTDSRRSSASMSTLTRRRSHLLGRKETSATEEEGWEEDAEYEEGHHHDSEGIADRASMSTPRPSESRCATPLARDANAAAAAAAAAASGRPGHAQRNQSDPSSYVTGSDGVGRRPQDPSKASAWIRQHRYGMTPSSSDPVNVAGVTSNQGDALPMCTSPEPMMAAPMSAPATTMSFNVGQVIPGSQATMEFPPLPDCVVSSQRRVGSTSPPLPKTRYDGPSITAAFMAGGERGRG